MNGLASMIRRIAREQGLPEAREYGTGNGRLYDVTVETLAPAPSRKRAILVEAESVNGATTLALGALFGAHRAQLLVEAPSDSAALGANIDAAGDYVGEGIVVSTRGRALTGRVRVSTIRR